MSLLPPPSCWVLGGGRYRCSSFRFWPSHDLGGLTRPVSLLPPPHPPGYDHDLRVKHHSDALTEKHGAAAGEWREHVGNRRNKNRLMRVSPAAALTHLIIFNEQVQFHYCPSSEHTHTHSYCTWPHVFVYIKTSSCFPTDWMFPRVPLRKGRRSGHRDRLLHPLYQCLRQAGSERVRPADRNHPRAPPEEDLRLPHSGQTQINDNVMDWVFFKAEDDVLKHLVLFATQTYSVYCQRGQKETRKYSRLPCI